MKALGLIEVYGYLPAVEALDSAVKAANVSLVDVTLVEGGLVAVMITGDVGAVKAAMEAAKVSASKVGKLISVHVIARPSEELDKILTYKNKQEIIGFKEEAASKEVVIESDIQLEVELMDTSHEEEISERSVHHELQDAVKEVTGETVLQESNHRLTIAEMEQMTVDRLRKLARELDVDNMTRKEIRFATKHELIDKIGKFIEEERD